jgi:hypothetical protein
LFDSGVFVIQYLIAISKTLLQLSLYSQTLSINETNFVLSYLVYCVSIGLQFTLTITVTLLQIIIKIIILIAQTTTNVAYIVFTTFARISIITLHSILFVLDAIEAWINSVVRAIVHVIEIPFNILDSFGLAMKPYIDFFGRHVAMTGEDFSNGVSSIGKAASYMSTSK